MKSDKFTPKRLIEEIEKFPLRNYYCYDISIENQAKFIGGLKGQLKKGINVIDTRGSIEALLALKKYNFKLLIIQNTGEIINQLDNLEPFEILFKKLKEKDISLLFLFNNKIRGTKADTWRDFAEKKIDLFEVTIDFSKEPGIIENVSPKNKIERNTNEIADNTKVPGKKNESITYNNDKDSKRPLGRNFFTKKIWARVRFFFNRIFFSFFKETSKKEQLWINIIGGLIVALILAIIAMIIKII